MERDHEFTVTLPGGTYVVELLAGVRLESAEGVVRGQWPTFGLEAKSDTEAKVYDELLNDLQQQIGAGPGAPEFAAFEAYVHEHGTLLSAADALAREAVEVREIALRWRITDAEQYTVRLWQDIELARDGDTVSAHAFELTGSGRHTGEALQALSKAVTEACGEPGAPGPRFTEFTAWVREHGEPVDALLLAQEEQDKQVYLSARDKLTAITPDDIAAESSTGIPLLVDFWAEWCGPCRRVTPVLVELSQQWAGRVLVRKIDVDRFDGIWERFGFRGIPAILMFKDGNEIHRVIGFGGKNHLIAELEPHLG
ncbi:thioredoxin domain-containing protein [Nocardia sp. NPDC050712]|uniref:thioredoxin family protein n=1 Tax=Nocardia sp. NPDC050712 TaxID=3155518 RepID=UPI0034040AFE